MRMTLIILLALCNISYVCAEVQDESGKKHKQYDQRYNERIERLEHLYQDTLSRYNDLKLEYDALKQNSEVLSHSIKGIDSQVDGNGNEIARLSKTYSKHEHRHDIEDYESNWISYLLAGVTLIVTALGVVIALLAFWGYRDIKNAAVAESISKSKELTESLVVSAIEEGRLSNLISAAVDRAVYRDVLSRDEFPPELDDITEVGSDDEKK